MDLAANQYICPDGYGVVRFLDEAVAAGFRSVALTRAALAEMSPAELRRAVEARKMSVTTLNSAGYFTWAEPARRRAQDTENRSLIAAAAELGADTLCVITGGSAEQPDVASARSLIAEGLAELDALAVAEGVSLGLEPIHPKDVATKGCVNTIAQARALIAPLQATGLIVDLYHSWWDPDLIAVAAEPCVRVLQICNVTAGLSRSADLTQGILDVGTLVDQITQAGFAGPVEFEIFAADHGQADVAPLLSAAAAWARA
ncbi:MAG: sugar phosphate isomerase/epimerase family protein [Pseudomonadota bacterium]